MNEITSEKKLCAEKKESLNAICNLYGHSYFGTPLKCIAIGTSVGIGLCVCALVFVPMINRHALANTSHCCTICTEERYPPVLLFIR